MGLSDNVALTALVVSLIALIIALMQMMQAFLGTAEGYRRCAEPVVGPWHRMRWRHWIWSEFRYESHFITPQICLYAPDDLEYFEKRGAALRLVDATPSQEMRWPSWRPWRLLNVQKRRDALKLAHLVLDATVTDKPEERPSHHESAASSDTSLDGQKQTVLPVHDSGPRAVRVEIIVQSENKASWILLLARLHKAYSGYKQKYRSALPSAILEDEQPPSTAAAGVSHSAPSDHGLSRRNVRTEVAIKFNEWTWDLMPNDAVKPLAMTTLGTLIIIAYRLGMQWRSTDLAKGAPLADGNGYSLSMTEYPGLGWVAKVSTTGVQGNFPDLIPGRATDKLMCGILPGAKSLVDQDIALVEEEGRACDAFETVISRICLDDTLRKSWAKKDIWNGWRPHDEATVFLCEFLPVCGSSGVSHYRWGGTKYVGSAAVHFWEGRHALRRHLMERKSSGLPSDTLSRVLDYFNMLESGFRTDFYGRARRSALYALEVRHSEKLEERCKKQADLIELCRRIYTWTTNWFIDHGYHQRDHVDDFNFTTRYMHLVAAHCAVSEAEYYPVSKKMRELRDRRDWVAYKREHYIKNNGVPYPKAGFNVGGYEMARAYIENVNKQDSDLIRYLRTLDTDINDTDETIREAWWVMMLRGTAWDMSTIQRTKGDPVPSSSYDNGTPVWIT